MLHLRIIKKVKDLFLKLQDHHMTGDSLLMLSSQGIIILLNLVSSAFLARNLSVKNLGEYQLIIAYLGIVMITALPGMNTAIYKSILNGQDAIYSKAFARSLYSILITITILLISSLVSIFFFSNKNVGLSLLFLCFLLPASGLQKYDSVLLPKCKFKSSRYIRVFFSALTAAAVSISSFLTNNYKIVLITFGSINILHTLWGHITVLKNLKDRSSVKEEEKRVLRQGWEFTALAAFNMIITKVDKIILGVINPSVLAIYYIGTIVPRLIKDNLKSISAVPIAWWGQKSPQRNINKLISHWYKILIFGICISAGIIVSVPFLIPLFFGKEYHKSILIAQVLSLSIPTNILATFVFSFDMFQKQGRFVQINSYIQKALYCISLLIFLQFWKIKAVVISVLIMEFYRGLTACVYLYRISRNPVKSSAPVKS